MVSERALAADVAALAAWKSRLREAVALAESKRADQWVVFAVPRHIDARFFAESSTVPLSTQTVHFYAQDVALGLDRALGMCSHCRTASDAERIMSKRVGDEMTLEKLAHLWLLYEIERDR